MIDVEDYRIIADEREELAKEVLILKSRIRELEAERDSYKSIAEKWANVATISSKDNDNLRALNAELLEKLKNIANDKPKDWGDQKDDFQAWAHNRAKFEIAKAEAQNGTNK